MYEFLIQNNPHKHVEYVNAAVWNKDEIMDFFICSNEVSSSLGTWDGSNLIDQIKVQTINLYNFLQKKRIDEIEMYISDIQGADFTALKTLKPMIDGRKIKEMILETHNDGAFPYHGLDNQFKLFKDLLSTNYKVADIKCDSIPYPGTDSVDPKYQEFDVHWILK